MNQSHRNVYFDKSRAARGLQDPWRVQFCIRKRNYYGGYYRTKEEAIEVAAQLRVALAVDDPGRPSYIDAMNLTYKALRQYIPCDNEVQSYKWAEKWLRILCTTGLKKDRAAKEVGVPMKCKANDLKKHELRIQKQRKEAQAEELRDVMGSPEPECKPDEPS